MKENFLMLCLLTFVIMLITYITLNQGLRICLLICIVVFLVLFTINLFPFVVVLLCVLPYADGCFPSIQYCFLPLLSLSSN